jgi:hypothetical protein
MAATSSTRKPVRPWSRSPAAPSRRRAVAKEQPLTAPERAAAFLRALATGRLIRARGVAVVVAHPDDEAIGVGAQAAC